MLPHLTQANLVVTLLLLSDAHADWLRICLWTSGVWARRPAGDPPVPVSKVPPRWWFWTLQSGFSRLRGPSEGPKKSCRPGAGRVESEVLARPLRPPTHSPPSIFPKKQKNVKCHGVDMVQCDAGGGAARRPARAGRARSTWSEVAMGAAALAITTLAATLGLRDRGLPGSRTGGP